MYMWWKSHSKQKGFLKKTQKNYQVIYATLQILAASSMFIQMNTNLTQSLLKTIT